MSTTSTTAKKLKEYEAWRLILINTITQYHAWLIKSQKGDNVSELHLHDIIQSIKNDRLMTAFIGDHGGGKTELINALFFSDFEFRLLPSDIARSCSFEIYWDKDQEPSLNLLSIDTKKTDDTITYLKTTSNIWEKFKLDERYPHELQKMLTKIVERKEVTKKEAEELGLWDLANEAMVEELNKQDYVSVPAWRHAVINLPHPILESGLIIFYTSKLGNPESELEVSLDFIPNTDAVILVTTADTKIKDADLYTWEHHVKNKVENKFVVLNKIDRLWNERQPEQVTQNKINQHITVMAHQLRLAPDAVFPLSARAAVNAKLQNNQTMLDESRINKFEEVFVEKIITSKQEVIGDTIARECSEMIKASRRLLQSRIMSLHQQIEELKSLQGKSINESKAILTKVITERKRYEASMITFNKANKKVTDRGNQLLKHLSAAYLDTAIVKSRLEIKKSTTTFTLNKGMRDLMKQATKLADQITNESNEIKNLADNIYNVFQTQYQFSDFTVPTLNLGRFLSDMRSLEQMTDDFCKNPVNVMTEKHFLVRKFFSGLGVQAQKIFEKNRLHCEDWLNNVMSRLELQIAEHKKTLEERAKNLLEAKESEKSLERQLASIENGYNVLNLQSKAMDTMLLNMMTVMQPALKAKQSANNFELNDALENIKNE